MTTECRFCGQEHDTRQPCQPISERLPFYIAACRKAAGLCPKCSCDHKCEDHQEAK